MMRVFIGFIFNLQFFLSFLLILTPPVQPLFGTGRTSLQTDALTLVFDEPLRSVAEQVADSYPGLRQDLEKIFRWSLDFRPTVVLIKDSQQFQHIAGTDLIVAFAAPQRNQVVIDFSKMSTTPFNLETTLKHELCHLLLHRYIGREKLPKWLDEGVSQWASDGVAEVIMDYKRAILPQAISSGRYFKMRSLSESFPKDRGSLQLAYAQSKSFVDYISREFGKTSLLNLLDSLKNGLSIEAAVAESLSIPFDELEKGGWTISK